MNYRPNSSSREWGYDYRDFVWKSEPEIFSGDMDCYYAPPKLMQYTYSAEASLIDIRNNDAVGELMLQHLIWGQGDRNAENLSAKPEATDENGESVSFLEPNTGWNRTFTNAEFTMKGRFRPVEAVNTLAENSQSSGSTYEGSVVLNGDGDNGLSQVEPNGGKVYHATADFYDFFSDWEIAGNPLSAHTLSYSYENADMQRFKLFDLEYGSYTPTEIETTTTYQEIKKWTFPTDTETSSETSGDYTITSVGDWKFSRLTDVASQTLIELNTENTHSSDGTGALHLLRQSNAEHHLYLPAAEYLVDGKNYTFSMWLYGINSPNYRPGLKIEYINDAGEKDDTKTIVVKSFEVTTGQTWTECSETFTYHAEDGYTVRLCIEINNKNVYLDDITLTEVITTTEEVEGTGFQDPVTVIEREIAVRKNNADTTAGTNAGTLVNQYSDKDAYTLSGTVTAVNSGTLTVSIYYYANENSRVPAESRTLGTFAVEAGVETEIAVKNFEHLPGHKAAKLVIQMEDGSAFVADLEYYKDYFTLSETGSFSEGTDRISYSYQGMLWNQAISDYYSALYADTVNTDSDTENDIIPLYFASNSWLTGNGRYDLEDNYDTLTGFSQTDVTDAAKFITLNPDNVGTYLFPYERQYLKELFGFNRNASTPFVTVDKMNKPFGQSNSRAVTGLVERVPVIQADGTTSYEIRLTNTAENSPYFNQAFIEGDNSMNAKLGNFYNDVKFDFVFNEDTGYFEYDSTRAKYATRVTQGTDPVTGEPYYYMDYYNYNEIVFENQDLAGVKKADASIYDANGSSQTIYQFFPFNSPLTNNKFATENLMFSMNLDIPFNTYADKSLRSESMFKFSGDDDVWVYVDEKLALDIGGTHTAVGGLVDLKNGFAVTGSSYLDKTGSIMTTDGEYSDGTFVKGTDEGVTDVEKAAFALIASARIMNASGNDDVEVGVDESKAGTDIPIVAYAINGTEGIYAHFFDDVYVAADGTPTYSYTIDKTAGTITVTFTNLKKNTTSTELKKYGLEDSNGNFVTSGTATFALSEFSIDGEGSVETIGNTDLTKHNLSVYYMERGLNSTNFKMEFNFVQATTREVSKEWADGLEEHQNTADEVEVELYRTEPTEIETEIPVTEWQPETEAYSIDDNIMYVKVQANRGDGANSQSNERFYAKEEEILVFYKKYGVDRNLYLNINGVNVSREMYDRYRDTDVPDGEADTSLFYIYLEATDGSGTIIEPFSSDNAATYLGSDDNGSYIYVPAGYQLWVQVNDEYLSQWKTTAVPQAADLETYGLGGSYTLSSSGMYQNEVESTSLNQWILGDVQGFLIDATLYERGEDGASGTICNNNSTSQGSIPSDTGARKTYIDSTSGMTFGEDGTKLNFVILKNKQFHNSGVEAEYYSYRMDVLLVPEGHTISMESTVANGRIRAVSSRVTNWYGSETSFAARNCDGAYGVLNGVMQFLDIGYMETVGQDKPDHADYQIHYESSDPWSLIVTPTANTLIEYSAHDRFSRASNEEEQRGTSFSPPTIRLLRATGNQILVETGETTIQRIDTYTDAILIDTVTLNNENDWTHLFDTIREGEPVDGVMKEYRYFIREVTVNSTYGTIADYKQIYYDADGNVLEPQYIPYNGQILTLYPNASSVKVANIPLTDLNLEKVWGDTVSDEDKSSQVYLRVYSSTDSVNGKLVGRYTISSANDWKTVLENLPLYEPIVTANEDGKQTISWKKITYYAAEDPVYYWRDDGGDGLNQVQFLAIYAPSVKTTLKVDAVDTVVYKFNDANQRELALTTENLLNNPGKFSLQLQKQSEDGKEYLSGAEFELYQLVGTEYELVKTSITDANGSISFGLIDVSEDETIGDSVTFRLVETKAPAGFLLPEDGNAIEFTVTQGAEKALTLTSTSYGDLVSHETTEDMTVIRFKVKNQVKPISIPSTGGSSVVWVYLGGILLLFTAFAGVQLRDKSQQKS